VHHLTFFILGVAVGHHAQPDRDLVIFVGTAAGDIVLGALGGFVGAIDL
jgi:hypothetical protein